MSTNLYVDLDAGRLVRSLRSTAPVSPTNFFRGDVRTVNVYCLRQTGINGAPYASADISASSCKVAIGDTTGAPTSGAWTLDGNSLSWDATAAAVQTALRTSQSDASLTVTGSMADGFTVTWGANGAESNLSGSVVGLLPECDLSIGERRAGSVSAKEQQFVRVRLTPGAYQDTWDNITATVTPTVSTVAGGSASVSEIQKIVFDKEPLTGSWTITMPADTRTVTTAVVAGLFTTTANHGLVVGQPVTPSGFTNVANFSNGTTYFVQAIRSETAFTIATTVGGTALTTATADAGSGTITTTARVTSQLDGAATAAQVQAALEALDSVGTGNVSVTGVPASTYTIAYQGAKALANLPPVTVEAGGLQAATGKTAELSLATFQMADLLGSEESRTLTLEIQLVDSGVTETAISQDVVIPADLIDGATLTPQTRSFSFSDMDTGSATAGQILVADGAGGIDFGNDLRVEEYTETVVAVGTVTTASTLSIASGTVLTATLTASTACTFTMPTATAGKSFTLLLKQAAATGNGTATFTGVKWDAAGTPVVTATAGKMDIVTFVADGTSWYGSIIKGFTP